MKKANCEQTNFLKGVSMLDAVRRNAKTIWLLLIITALNAAVRGGHSILDRPDPSFNPQIQTIALGQKLVEQIISLPDGKMLVAGNFNTFNGQTVGGLVRLNADGTLDTTFNSNLPGDGGKEMVLQPDGKIVIAVSHPTRAGIFRLNADGSVDTTFNAPLGGWLLAIDASGRIIAGGSFFIGGSSRNIVRLNSNGSVDSTFQSTLNVFQVTAIAAQNNKIIVGYDNAPSAIQRLNEDGTIDSSFMTRNLGHTRSIITQLDGKILIYGNSDLRRLNQDGTDDTGFTTTTFPSAPSGYRYQVIALSSDGKITIVNRLSNGIHQIKRFLSNGTVDGSFTPYTAVRFSSLAVQADGGVLIGDGGGDQFTNDFVRLLPNGSPDPAFNTGIGFQTFNPSRVNAINVQPDGKILIGGEFGFVNDVPRSKIARINPDSTLDTSFQINTSVTGNYFTTISSFHYISALNDGKIIVKGSFTYRVNGVFKHNVVRLNPDGSIDPTYLNATHTVGPEYQTIKTYPDGKLIVGDGRLSSYDENPHLSRLFANGTRDPDFNPILYPVGWIVIIKALEIQPDGKILVGGRLWHVTSGNMYIYRSFLTRINADGSLDTTFQTREQPDREVRAFVLQPDGKIVISETTTNHLEPYQSNVLRLNADGTVDPTFNAGTGASGKVNTMLLHSTGRIFVGGSFTHFNGQARANLVQLNADGSVFTPVYNLNNEVFCLAIDSDGRVLVGGNFTTIIAGGSSAPRSYVARLIDASASATRFDFNGDGRADLGIYSAADGMWSILNSLSYQTLSTQFGMSEDKTVAADFDGDFRTDIAVFRPSDGTWYLKQSTGASRAVRWGAAEDKPAAGDFDGDRKADVAVWRPSTGSWYVLQSSNNQMFSVNFGLTGDVPLPGADFDGDGKADIAVWRPSDGNFYWLASGSAHQFRAVRFGAIGDIPAIGDFNGDRKTDLVVYRPAEGIWYQNLSAPNGDYTFVAMRFGLNGDEPVAADYDGDGKADVAVRRQGVWHILKSAQGYAAQAFGNADARAVAALTIQ
jgi:uncharacterized delta-60 repeat protein